MIRVEGTSTNTLSALPLARWFASAAEQRLTGTLVLQESDGDKHAVYVVAGAPRKARIAKSVIHLGECLLEEGVLDADAHADTLARTLNEGRLHGELLRAEHRISNLELRNGLREQLLRQVAWLFELPADTRYAFFEQTNYLARWGGDDEAAPVNALELIWRGIQGQTPSNDVDATVSQLREQTFSILPETPLDDFRFGPAVHQLVDVLRACKLGGAELLSSGLASEQEIARLLYVLSVTGYLDVGKRAESERPEPPQPSRLSLVASARPSSIPPASSGLVDLLEDVRHRVERPPQDHYEVLKLDPSASAGEIRAAFQALARRWSPVFLTQASVEVRDLADQVYAQVVEAHRVLSDPFRRAEYNALVRAGSAEPPQQPRLGPTYRVLMGVRRAEQLLAQGNLALAERETLAAIGDDCTQYELIGLHLWIRAHKPEESLPRLLALLDRALAKAPASVRLHWYRGLLLKKMEKHASALQEFRLIVEMAPHHTDAAREVHIYERTRDQWLSGPPRPGSGTFAKVAPAGLLERLFRAKR